MKRGAFALYAAAAVAAGFALIACSAEAMEAARASLRLCGEVLIPSLFPFFVLSGLIQELGLPSRLGRLAAPGMHRAYSSSLHQLRSVRVLYRQTNTLMLHRCSGR